MDAFRVAVAGNPNCGKTTLFNRLTGARQKVGNWPGVTVDRKQGRYQHEGVPFDVVDLPGTYSLSSGAAGSLDETIARDYLISGEPDVVVNIVDASNAERNLYLTTQLIEMRVPLVVALNMMDTAGQAGLEIDTETFAAGLGVAVVPMVASRGKGIAELKDAILEVAETRICSPVELPYAPAVRAAIADLSDAVADVARERRIDPGWLAVKSLTGDTRALALVNETGETALAAAHDKIRREAGEDADILVADGRYGFANALVRSAVAQRGKVSTRWTDRLDSLALNRALGIPIFFAIMYVMFLFTINLAGAFIDVFDQLAGALLVDGPATLMEGLGSPAWLIALLPNGVGAGVQTVATFIPVIGFLFLFLTVLEDSGYMARAAFVMDRAMRAIGLPGKSFVPMLLGFGCTVPAVMATRTLESRRDRIMTVMMSPFMSCGAKLPVYALFAAAFFPTGGQNLVFLLYLIGLGFAVVTGLVLKSTLFQGPASPFVMELPPYHLPNVKSALMTTWTRLRQFVVEAGRVIVVVVLVLSVLNSIGRDGSFGHEDSDTSVLASIGQELTPVVAPMGITEENWPATVGLFTGIFAKEAVVGTLNALYGQMAREDSGGAEAAFDLWGAVAGAFATVPANLREMMSSLTDPIGLDIGDVSSHESAAAEQEVSSGVFGAMVSRFDGRIGAFAYLLAILLYMPCVAAVAAINREVGTPWTLFIVAWSTALAYGTAVVAYQIGTFSRHPESAAIWITAIVSAFVAAVLVMRWLGGGRREPVAQAAPAE